MSFEFKVYTDSAKCMIYVHNTVGQGVNYYTT